MACTLNYRVRWLLAQLLIGDLRCDELAQARMGDFKPYPDQEVWVLQVTGKGASDVR